MKRPKSVMNSQTQQTSTELQSSFSQQSGLLRSISKTELSKSNNQVEQILTSLNLLLKKKIKANRKLPSRIKSFHMKCPFEEKTMNKAGDQVSIKKVSKDVSRYRTTNQMMRICFFNHKIKEIEALQEDLRILYTRIYLLRQLSNPYILPVRVQEDTLRFHLRQMKPMKTL
eukprot:403371782